MTALIVPAFVAGVLTFLAPCTLPLVPGYLAFISGVSPEEFEKMDISKGVRRRIFMNGLLYVIGFSVVFILLGSLFGLGGSAFVHYRLLLARVGGLLVILFGLFLLGAGKLKIFAFMNSDKKFHIGKSLKPGTPTSSFLFGATFAFGWTPCVGPILGTILLLASTSSTIGSGALLLFVFSLGLAVPFLALAIGIGSATTYIKKMYIYLPIISKVGGVFLLLIGFLLLFDQQQLVNGYLYQILNVVNYDSLLDYL